MNPTLAYKIKMLPESPGCYIMKSRGEIIYVGKAVNLKRMTNTTPICASTSTSPSPA